MNAEEQKHHFETEGYLIVEDLLSADEVLSSQAEIQNLHQQAADYFKTGDRRGGHFQREPYINADANGEPAQTVIQFCVRSSESDISRPSSLTWLGIPNWCRQCKI